MNTAQTFDVRPLVTGAAFAASVGTVAMIVIGAVVGIEWWLTAIITVQVSISFAVMGGWAAATIALDDEGEVNTVGSQAVPVPIRVETTARANVHRSRAA